MLYAGLFLLLACCILTVLIFQKNSVEKEISASETYLTELEIKIAEQQQDTAGTREMEQLLNEIQGIEGEATPVIPLFHVVYGLFGNTEQLVSYENVSANSFVVTASYPSMDDVANFIAAVSDLAYVSEVQLTSVITMEENYEAVLTVQLQEEILMEELSTNEEVIE